MKFKELTLCFAIGFMLASLLIAWSLKALFESGNYGQLLISGTCLVVCVYLIRVFVNITLDKNVPNYEMTGDNTNEVS